MLLALLANPLTWAVKPAQAKLLHRRWNGIGKLSMFVLLSMIGNMPAWATSCTMLAPASPIVGNIPLSGSITVARDVPVGTQLYSTTFWNNTGISITCDTGTYAYLKNLTVTPYARASWAAPKGAVAYQTNIPGIGVYIWSNANGLPYSMPAAITYTAGQGTLTISGGPGNISVWSSFDVSIVKISDPVGVGTLNGLSLPTVQFGIVGSSLAVTLNAQITGSLNVVSSTCTTPNVAVDLGSHYTSELKGVGTTTATWVSVPIALNNCPAFFGLNSSLTNTIGNPTTVTTGQLAANSVQYTVVPVASILVANQGVMALQPDGVNPTASGIGIQLADGNGNPLAYNQTNPSGLALTTTNNANYTINLRARYYQTAASTTAGQANGAATVTLIYN